MRDVGILRARVRWGLQKQTVPDDVLRTIADRAAGDARVAIGILRNAARVAAERELGALTQTVIDDAIPQTKAEIQRKNIEKLIDDQQVLYDIIGEQGEIAPADLYEQYRARVDDPKTERMVCNYLQKLQHYNLLRAKGENRGRIYCAVDSTG